MKVRNCLYDTVFAVLVLDHGRLVRSLLSPVVDIVVQQRQRFHGVHGASCRLSWIWPLLIANRPWLFCTWKRTLPWWSLPFTCRTMVSVPGITIPVNRQAMDRSCCGSEAASRLTISLTASGKCGRALDNDVRQAHLPGELAGGVNGKNECGYSRRRRKVTGGRWPWTLPMKRAARPIPPATPEAYLRPGPGPCR